MEHYTHADNVLDFKAMRGRRRVVHLDMAFSLLKEYFMRNNNYLLFFIDNNYNILVFMINIIIQRKKQTLSIKMNLNTRKEI